MFREKDKQTTTALKQKKALKGLKEMSAALDNYEKNQQEIERDREIRIAAEKTTLLNDKLTANDNAAKLQEEGRECLENPKTCLCDGHANQREREKKKKKHLKSYYSEEELKNMNKNHDFSVKQKDEVIYAKVAEKLAYRNMGNTCCGVCDCDVQSSLAKHLLIDDDLIEVFGFL